MFGDASVAQSVLSKGASGDFFSINWGFGIAVMLGIFVSGGVTGGHLNPAVTLAMAIGKQLHWKKVPIYFLAQYLGAFAAAAVRAVDRVFLVLARLDSFSRSRLVDLSTSAFCLFTSVLYGK